VTAVPVVAAVEGLLLLCVHLLEIGWFLMLFAMTGKLAAFMGIRPIATTITDVAEATLVLRISEVV